MSTPFFSAFLIIFSADFYTWASAFLNCFTASFFDFSASCLISCLTDFYANAGVVAVGAATGAAVGFTAVFGDLW